MDQWNFLEKRFHFLKVGPFFSLVIICLRKNGSSDNSDQSGTICEKKKRLKTLFSTAYRFLRGRPEMSTFFTYEIASHNFLTPPLLMRPVYIFHVSEIMR